MEYTNLGQSNIEVSRFGFGCCPLGEFGWGDTNHHELIKAVRYAFDNGVNFFDTADVYGFGKSEENLREALGNRMDNAVIASKFGMRKGNKGTFLDSSPKWIESALNESLKRLGRDYIDLYQLHWWDKVTPLSDVLGTLENLKTKGKIRLYGVTNLTWCDTMNDKKTDISSFSFEYSLVNRSNEKDIKEMIDKSRGTFLSWGSLGQGILSGKYNEKTIFDNNDRRSRTIYKNFHENLNRNLNIIDYLQNICSYYQGKSVANLAIRWILDIYTESIVLVGIKSIQQVNDNLKAFGWLLDNEHMKKLNTISLS